MITKASVYERIIEVLRDELLYSGELNPNTSISHLGLDSIQLMQLFVYLEEAFEFEFLEDSIIENMQDVSLDKFSNYVLAALEHVHAHTSAN